MKSTNDFLEALDFFGQKVEFNINGKKNTQTALGGLLALVVIMMIIASAWTLGKDIFLHEQPALVVQDLIETKRPSLTLDAYSFPISIVIQDIPSNAVYFNPSYFKMAVQLYEIDNSKGTTKTTDYALEKCEKHHFPTVSNDTFYSSGMNNYICIRNQNITISGYWDEPTVTYLMIRLLYCHDEPHCASKQEIDAFLMKKKITWNIYCLNSLIDTNNYEAPTQFYILNLYRMTQVYVSKIHEVYLQTLSSFTDMGIIFEEFKESTSIAFDFEKSDSTNEVSDRSLYDFLIFASNKKTVYKRRYVKVQALAANLGGIVKFLMTIASFLTYVFNVHKLNCILINNNIDVYRTLNNSEALYSPSLSPRRRTKSYRNSALVGNSPITQNTQSIQNTESIQNTQNFTNTLESYSNRPSFKTPEKNSPSLSNKTRAQFLRRKSEFGKVGKKVFLNFDFLEVFKKYLCPSKVSFKKQMYQDCKPILDEELDILNILSKLDDDQKLKLALFDREQLTLFSGMAKIEFGLENSESTKMRKVLKNIKNNLKTKVNKYKFSYMAQDDMEKESVNSRLVKFLSHEFC